MAVTVTEKGTVVSEAAVPAYPPNMLRIPRKEGLPPNEGTLDLTRAPVIGKVLSRVLKSRKYQFSIILPSQIIFWLVIIFGFVGVLDPTQNFATAITWYIWFALMFPLTVVAGRAWCLTCPYGGIGEWVQRKTFWKRTQKALGLGLKMPSFLANYGLLMSASIFIVLSWFEEYFNIAGPGVPYMTSAMVLGIIAFSIISFLVFERRSFCRYLCPLSSLIGSAGATGVVAGFRPRDKDVCLNCKTKECMRGGENGYGCPWYTYPATADTNTYCGLCSECYKTCPNENIGLYAQKPLTSVVTPKKNYTMAWVVGALFGLVLFQQFNATPLYGTIDGWLNDTLRFPGYPNPVDYFLTIGAVAGIFAGIAWLFSRTLTIKEQLSGSFGKWFAPFMYGLIPVMAADFLARVLPKFFGNASNLASSILGIFGTKVDWAGMPILSVDWVVNLQYIIIGIGTVAGAYAAVKIAGKDYKDLTNHRTLSRVLPAVFTLMLGAGLALLYMVIYGAQ